MNYLRSYWFIGAGIVLIGCGVFWFMNRSENEIITIHGAQFRVEVVDSILTISKGLSGHPPLAENQGMLFVFGSSAPRTFWMKEMNFPLDMIWIDGDVVIGVTKNVPAPDPKTPLAELPLYSSPGPASRVLEVNAGTVDRIGILSGDTVEMP